MSSSLDEKLELLRSHIQEQGMKNSRQREVISEVFFISEDHMRVEDILQRARAKDPKISQATVYRTMRFLMDCGLAEARNFEDGYTRYEPSDAGGAHHDHLICIKCGKIIEFVDDAIETLQGEVAARYGFHVISHKMELYGECFDPDCASKMK
mgnify:CR=1 FL=1